MSDPIALISSVAVTEAELTDLIVRANGFVEPGTPLFGRFSDGPCHIWIGLDLQDLEAALADAGEDHLAKLTAMLGGPPRTGVVVEISRTEGSETLALEFAVLFSARWPAVVDDLNRSLLTRDELLRRQAAGRGIRPLAAETPQAA